MWELIRSNRRKSVVLFVTMGGLLIVLGTLVGAYFDPKAGGPFGLLAAFGVWIVLSLVAYFQGDSILLHVSGAREVEKDVHPMLFNVVEEMKIAAALPAMPRIYIIDEAAPNAFATGRNPQKSAIAVTAGLLTRLNRDELQGVVAHEMSHILNRDILFMTFSSVMLGSIVFISDVFLRGSRFGGSGGRYRSGRSKAGGGLAIVAIVFAILAPIFARLLYFAISRRREYLADASAVRLTRYPDGLASALEILSRSEETLGAANKVTAPLFIVNPLKGEGMGISGLMSTHPPIEERVKILRMLTQGVNYANYQNAYRKLKGEGVLPASALADRETILARAPTATEGAPAGAMGLTAAAAKTPAAPVRKSVFAAVKRDTGDLMMRVNRYRFIECGCGLKLKIPPNFKKPEFVCPRCGKTLQVPR
jgi:heat shock protein HtpX